MSMIDRPFFVRLATAMAIVGATALLRLALGPWLGGQAAFLLFALALLAAAMIAGSRAATMATIPALGFGLLFSGQRNVESFEPAVAGTFLLTARSEEHTSELQSLMRISYAVFCLKKKNNKQNK